MKFAAKRAHVSCNAVLPGWTAPVMADWFFCHAADPAAARAAAEELPLSRCYQPVRPEHLVLWLASAEASFVSGSLFTIDGGLPAQSPIAPKAKMSLAVRCGGRATELPSL